MAHRKAESSTKNGRDSNPKYLGVKVNNGEMVGIGQVIVRQRGTKIIPGKNTSRGKDDTIFALKNGRVLFGNKRKIHFDNSVSDKKTVSVELVDKK